MKTLPITNKANTSKAVTPTSPAEQERLQILSDATPEFLKVLDEIKTHLAQEQVNIFESRYSIGRMISDMRKEEQENQGKYGSKCVDRLEKVIGYDRSVIYCSLRFYERYSEEDLKLLATLRSKKGNALTWTHVVHLSSIADAKVRKEIQAKVLTDDLTPKELLDYIQTKQGGKKPSNAGRPMARPKSVKGFIDQMFTFNNQLVNRKAQVWAGKQQDNDNTFFELLEDMPEDKVSKDLLTRLNDLQTSFETTALEMENMANDIARARMRLERSHAADDATTSDDDYEPPSKLSLLSNDVDDPLDDAESLEELDIEGSDDLEEEDEPEDDTRRSKPVYAKVSRPSVRR